MEISFWVQNTRPRDARNGEASEPVSIFVGKASQMSGCAGTAASLCVILSLIS
ncbi:hypothetical protein [uncultured Desulfovibrio sp.]|uniref:hypothetical protein n=1 Tax=uncultured Desulfovibrio sp. TaxID=167968 RepID=UPI0026349053|nr:hypothetical protein [uncultured Desulfovibrio sp.]